MAIKFQLQCENFFFSTFKCIYEIKRKIEREKFFNLNFFFGIKKDLFYSQKNRAAIRNSLSGHLSLNNKKKMGASE